MKQSSARQQGVELALAAAQGQLKGMDPQAVARQSASRWVGAAGQGDLEIDFLNCCYQVSFPEAEVKSRTVALRHPDSQIFIQSSAGRFAENTGDKGCITLPASGKAAGEQGEEPSLVRKVLILHYLIQAQGHGLAGRWIAFRGLPGGVVYYPVFRQRVIARLIRQFGERPERLIQAAAPLGGRAIAMADWAVEIPAFARVPLVLALWEGSPEFGPEAAVMFDEALPFYLETEDAIVACEEILGEMKQHVQSI
jgi:hypothetical protein